MRFFSNEAKENDQEGAGTEVAAVPQQRSGSPWSDTPGDDTLRRDDSEVRHDGDDAVRDSDAPGSSTPLASDRSDLRDATPHDSAVGTAEVRDSDVPDSDVRDSDVRTAELRDSDLRDSDVRTAELRDSDLGDSDVRTAELRDSDVRDADVRDADVRDADVRDADVPDSAAHDDLDLPLDDRSANRDSEDEWAGSHRATDGSVADSGLGAEQRSGTTTTYGPDGSLSTVDSDQAEADRVDDDRTGAAGSGPSTGTSAGPTDAVGADTTGTASGVTALGSGTTAGDTTADDRDTAAGDAADQPGSGAVAAVPVGAADAATTGTTTDTTTGAKPDTTAASPVADRLFTDGDSFSDRLREVALTFVDEPKEATQQAAALVDEAIDKLAGSLKAQKDALAGQGDDTEKLRVELRGYREILKRITSL